MSGIVPRTFTVLERCVPVAWAGLRWSHPNSHTPALLQETYRHLVACARLGGWYRLGPNKGRSIW